MKCAGILDLNTSWYVAVTAKDLLHTGMISFLPNDFYCIKYVKNLATPSNLAARIGENNCVYTSKP